MRHQRTHSAYRIRANQCCMWCLLWLHVSSVHSRYVRALPKGLRRPCRDFAHRRLAGGGAHMLERTPDGIPDAGCGAYGGSSQPAPSPCSPVYPCAQPGQAGGHCREAVAGQGKGKRAPLTDPMHCRPCSSGQMTLQQQSHLPASMGQGGRLMAWSLLCRGVMSTRTWRPPQPPRAPVEGRPGQL